MYIQNIIIKQLSSHTAIYCQVAELPYTCHKKIGQSRHPFEKAARHKGLGGVL